MATSSAIVTGYPNLGDGTVSLPGLAFQNDQDTGLYRIGANTIGIATNGTRVGEIGVGYGGFTGNVIQVVNGTATGTGNTSGTTFIVFTGLNTNFTPKYNNSKILIRISGTWYGNGGPGSDCSGYLGIRKTISGVDTDILTQFIDADQRSSYQPGQVAYPFILEAYDTATSLNIITYKLIYRNSAGFISFGVGYNTNSTYNINIMEIQQ